MDEHLQLGRIRLGRRVVDLQGRWVALPGGARATLRPLEARLLAYLHARRGVATSRRELLSEVWGYREGVSSRTVDTTVKTLRRKIEPDPGEPVFLLTARGLGYRLEVETPPPFSPTQGPGLFGRREELSTLSSLWLRGARWVTLTGPPGVGKSALAEANLVDSALGRIARVDLRQVRDAADLQHRVAAAVSPDALMAGADPAALMARAGPLWLLLDNAEHVLDPLSRALPGWMSRAPELRALVTSREPLGLRGERLLSVRPLVLPDLGVRALAELERVPASALFIAWARRAAPDRDLQGAGPAINELVRRLDGLPLAIELAAGRSHQLGPEGILRGLDARFVLLSRRPSSARPGDSLAGTLAWSWDLLGPEAQRALAALSVVRGPFDLATAACIVAGVLRVPGEATAVVLALADKNLLAPVRRRGSGGCDFRMLESIRAYAGHRLDGASLAGDHGAILQIARERLVARLADQVRRDPLDPARALWDRLGDLEDAASWARDTGSAQLGPLAHGLCAVLYHVGKSSRFEALFQALEGVSMPGPWGLYLVVWQQLAACGEGRPAEAMAPLEEALRRARQLGDDAVVWFILGVLGRASFLVGDVSGAHGRFAVSLRVADALGDPRRQARSLEDMALASMHCGHTLEAARHLDRAATLPLGPAPLVRRARQHSLRSELALQEGRFEDALAAIGEALACARRLGSVRHEGILQATRARVLGQLDDYEAQEEALIRARWCARHVGDQVTLERIEVAWQGRGADRRR